MGVPSASFIDTYSVKVTDLMINLVEYIQAMDNLLTPLVQTGTALRTGTRIGLRINSAPLLNRNSSTLLHLQKNANGYPILPDPLPTEGWKKKAWDCLFTDYLGQQYHLAFAGKIKHIPY